MEKSRSYFSEKSDEINIRSQVSNNPNFKKKMEKILQQFNHVIGTQNQIFFQAELKNLEGSGWCRRGSGNPLHCLGESRNSLPPPPDWVNTYLKTPFFLCFGIQEREFCFLLKGLGGSGSVLPPLSCPPKLFTLDDEYTFLNSVIGIRNTCQESARSAKEKLWQFLEEIGLPIK